MIINEWMNRFYLSIHPSVKNPNGSSCQEHFSSGLLTPVLVLLLHSYVTLWIWRVNFQSNSVQWNCLQWRKCCVSVQSSMAATSHRWLLNTWTVASAVLLNLNLNSHMWLVATISDSIILDTFNVYIQYRITCILYPCKNSIAVWVFMWKDFSPFSATWFFDLFCFGCLSLAH